MIKMNDNDDEKNMIANNAWDLGTDIHTTLSINTCFKSVQHWCRKVSLVSTRSTGSKIFPDFQIVQGKSQMVCFEIKFGTRFVVRKR